MFAMPTIWTGTRTPIAWTLYRRRQGFCPRLRAWEAAYTSTTSALRLWTQSRRLQRPERACFPLPLGDEDGGRSFNVLLFEGFCL
jgi:hypothetical protein